MRALLPRGALLASVAFSLSITSAIDPAPGRTRAARAARAVRAAQPLTLTVNTSAPFPISPFIYGMNFAEEGGSPRGAAPWFGATLPPEVTLSRFGGNRLSAFNWETGASNIGRDGNGTWANDRYLLHSGNGAWRYADELGGAVSGRLDAARRRHQAMLLTIPMLDHVASASASLDTSGATRIRRLAQYFRRNEPSPGVKPAHGGDAVYQDQFVRFVKSRVSGDERQAGQTVFFGLDNEPDIWIETHAELVDQRWTYDDFASRSARFARAVKSVMPNTMVFGPSVATYTGVVAGDRYHNGWIDDPRHGRANFFDVYLDAMRAAERDSGHRLLDVLDLHWYPAVGTRAGEIGNDYAPQDRAMIDARLQAPRSLWDSSFVEDSWVTRVTGGAIRLLPRLREQIVRHYPGTKVAISEYYYGRGGDISGGLAQADLLGIFGQQGVFAAALWPNAGVYAAPYKGDGSKAYAYLFAAFRLFLNYDGAGHHFGPIGVPAVASDPSVASVYASHDSGGTVTVIAINKSQDDDVPVTLAVKHPTALRRVVGEYRLTGNSPEIAHVTATDVAAQGSSPGISRFRYRMPKLSATVIVLAP